MGSRMERQNNKEKEKDIDKINDKNKRKKGVQKNGQMQTGKETDRRMKDGMKGERAGKLTEREGETD